ncbi:MAG TPA: penicillin-binding protein 2 [Patescibacteria group bacterium]|nr:penicillin-binding protein 2 [Patescibacteria group bacterium]
MALFAVFLLSAFGIILYRLYILQIIKHTEYVKAAESQYTAQAKLPATRGEIRVTDRFSDGYYQIAVSVKRSLAFANPRAIVDSEQFAEILSPALGIPKTELVEKIKDKNRAYVPLKKRLTPDEEQRLRDLKVQGLGFDYEYVRVYPEKNFLSHVIGYVGYKEDERVGLYGIEKAFEDDLRGVDGRITDDSGGFWDLGGKKVVPAEDGVSLLLTIDKSIQYQAEKLLEETVTSHEADSGSVVVLDPKTGRVLALAGFPDFDPNEYNKVTDLSVFSNQVTVGTYEPGSIMKPITMAASLNEGKITPDTTYTDTGVVKVDGFEIKNADKKSHGKKTMTQVLELSLNTGAIFAKEQLGNALFYEYMKRFGFGRLTGIELPENKGNIDNLSGNIKVNFDTASFGQGITVTPLQMATAFTAIASNGLMRKPYIVQAKIYADGRIEETRASEPIQVISPTTSRKVANMMLSVVENGHGKKAKVAGYYLAGKTGTAQVPKANGKGYEENNNIGSFVGFAPFENPKFVMLVRINHPKDVTYAETTAAPMFGQLAKFILNYYNIPPTRDVKK